MITGTGRCGTGYIAAVLTRLGIPCGHEAIYGPDRVQRRRDLRGDASYLAATHLGSFDGVIVHQTRDPLMTIGSLLANGFFDRLPGDKWLQPVTRVMKLSGRPLHDAMRYYVAWNAIIDPLASVRVKVERMGDGLPAILDAIGELADPEDLVTALTEVSPLTNHRADVPRLAWGDLPEGKDLEELRALSLVYGYPVG